MRAIAADLPILWVIIGLILFGGGPRPRAVLICLLGTLFLPEIQSSPISPDAILPIRFPLLEFTKVNAMSYALLLGLLLFDAPRIAQIHWNLFDLPALAAGLMPSIATLVNGATSEVAFAEFRASFMVWTVPYFVGRIYLSDYWGISLVVHAIAMGGLIYIPFCLYEMRFSAVLHARVFGFQQHEFAQTMRLGGNRPMVFMQHGLAVGLWMVSSSLCLFWLWYTRCWPTPRTPWFMRNIPGITPLVLTITTILCRSFGALALGFVGFVTLILSNKIRTRFFLIVLLLIPPTYVLSRLGHWWNTKDLIDTVKQATRLVGREGQEERSKSLEFRLDNEDTLMRMVREQSWFGMGGGALTRPKDEEGRPIIPDARWIIAYYDTGMIGVTLLLVLLVVPGLRFAILHPPATWGLPQIAPAAVAAVVLAVVACDCMFNSMLNPMYFLLMAALNGWCNGVGDPRSQTTLRYLANPFPAKVA